MQAYRYPWNLEASPDVRVTVEVAAGSAMVAGRSVRHFLASPQFLPRR